MFCWLKVQWESLRVKGSFSLYTFISQLPCAAVNNISIIIIDHMSTVISCSDQPTELSPNSDFPLDIWSILGSFSSFFILWPPAVLLHSHRLILRHSRQLINSHYLPSAKQQAELVAKLAERLAGIEGHIFPFRAGGVHKETCILAYWRVKQQYCSASGCTPLPLILTPWIWPVCQLTETTVLLLEFNFKTDPEPVISDRYIAA